MIKYLRAVNDIHLDFDMQKRVALWTPAPLPTDSETAFIVAGDIANGKEKPRVLNWLVERSKQFDSVIAVLGNHDYWVGNIETDVAWYGSHLAELNVSNVHVLQNSSVEIDGVRFLGGTLWTDFNGQDPITQMFFPQRMHNDSVLMNKSYADDGRTLIPSAPQPTWEYIYAQFLQTKKYIFDNLERKDSRKIVVVTHHGPSFKSIDPMYEADKIGNGYYVSELGNEIAYRDIDFWFHGHTHSSMDYTIGSCRIINNARGYNHYPEDLNPKFDEKLLITL